MVEFAPNPQKKSNSFTLITATVLAVIILGAVFSLIHFQKKTPAESVSPAVEVPGLLRPGNTDFEYYKTRIRIENVKAVLGISFNKARIAMISGTILNDGDRRLDALELHIILYDVWGKISKERTAFALRPRAGYSSKPMEPLEKRRFSIGVESVEYYWDPKQITYEITGLRYE